MQQEDVNDFFRPIHSQMEIPDGDYGKTAICIAMANALARNTNHSLYIIDYNRKNFLYVSPNPLFLCGHSPEEVQQKGYAFYFEVVPPDEINRLMEINEAGFRFYYDQPVEKRLDLSIEYNFHIRTSEKHSHLIHHKLTPVMLSEKGDIWLALCTVSLSPEKKLGEVLITDHTCTDRHVYSFEGRRWRKQPEQILSDREKEILQLSVKGLSNTEIGGTLFIDANTVKFHKKKLFEKLHAENITEAVGIAANLRLI
nr:helix-turn-helix transcriptional regulator [uncultured Mediterranea sp.]